MIERLCTGAMQLTVLWVTACMLKYIIPDGSMQRSAQKAVELVALGEFIRIISGVLPNG